MKLFSIERLIGTIIGLLVAAYAIAWHENIPMGELFWTLVRASVFIGGWLNAYGLATQTYLLWKAGRGEGHSMQMYGLFLFIQVSLALNGVRHDDWMQASGMFASMIPTIWSMALIRHFLKNPRS